MLRRLHHEQPASFAFTPANLDWAKGQVTKYPAGRQQSAIIPLLFRAQEQEGWLSRPAIEHVADLLGMPYIRALEVATFYFMFQLAPVGSVAHIQICGTTSCMICGAEDLMKVCKEKIAAHPYEISADGKLSWEEVECLGACTNAPMAAIGKDYFEDLTTENFGALLDDLRAGKTPVPGPRNGRFSSEPQSGLTSLNVDKPHTQYNGTAQLSVDLQDGIKRIDGTEVAFRTPWTQGANHAGAAGAANPNTANLGALAVGTAIASDAAPSNVTKPEAAAESAKPAASVPADATGVTVHEAQATSKAKPVSKDEPAAADLAEIVATDADKPATLSAARDGKADDLKMIKGVGPKMEDMLHFLGFYHFDQIAAWKANELAWVDQNLEGFKGRASRDEWVAQAKDLASGVETEFSARAKKDGMYND